MLPKKVREVYKNNENLHLRICLDKGVHRSHPPLGGVVGGLGTVGGRRRPIATVPPAPGDLLAGASWQDLLAGTSWQGAGQAEGQQGGQAGQEL